MLPSFCRETVIIRRAPLKEVRGSLVRDWANFTTHTLACCSVQPSATSSADERAEQSTNRWELYAPPCSDVQRGDRVEYKGTVYEIDGDPYVWKSPTGRVTHLHAHLEEWVG